MTFGLIPNWWWSCQAWLNSSTCQRTMKSAGRYLRLHQVENRKLSRSPFLGASFDLTGLSMFIRGHLGCGRCEGLDAQRTQRPSPEWKGGSGAFVVTGVTTRELCQGEPDPLNLLYDFFAAPRSIFASFLLTCLPHVTGAVFFGNPRCCPQVGDLNATQNHAVSRLNPRNPCKVQ